MLLKYLQILFVLIILNSSQCQNVVKPIYGYKNYTEAELGNVNIMISSPHSGLLKPLNITDRTEDALDDYNTRLIAKTIKSELTRLFLTKKNISAVPFNVYNNLRRKKMDPNRVLSEAVFNQSEDSFKAYKDYHNVIENYFCKQFMLNSSYVQGLLLDIHGQTHNENWTEIGYALSSSQLNKAILNKTLARSSSIYRLSTLSNQTFDSLIRGNEYSLGGIMQNMFNFKVVPSPKYPSPGGGKYFNGGFITNYYSSIGMEKYKINAIQIEVTYQLRFGSDSQVIENAKKIAASVYQFYFKNSFNKKF